MTKKSHRHGVRDAGPSHGRPRAGVDVGESGSRPGGRRSRPGYSNSLRGGSAPQRRGGAARLSCALRAALALGMALLAAVTATPALAQSYHFAVPTMRMVNEIRPDASIAIHYEIVFDNRPGAHAIDIVDVGMPAEGYEIGQIRAAVDGEPAGRIVPSTYIDIGVEVHLRSAIPSGNTGTFTYSAVMPNMVYSDTTDDALASFRITPTWFDGSLLWGSTRLEVMVVLPAGVAPEQVLHQGQEFADRGRLEDGRAFALWQFPSVRVDGPHLVGLSFPRGAMSRVIEMTRWMLLVAWWEAAKGLRLLLGAGFLVLFGVVFFRFSAKTGCIVYVVAAAGLTFLFVKSPTAHLVLLPFLLGGLVLMEWSLRRKRRRYLPPLANVEGGGIKRGLTAPEAAVLLERPLGQVLTLVLFGLVKKGFVVARQADPLELELAPAMQGAGPAQRRTAAADLGAVLHNYEHAFLDAIEERPGRVSAMGFGDAMKGLLDALGARMRGFDVSDTQDYYRGIVERAWKEAELAVPGSVDDSARTDLVEKRIDWLLVADDSPRRFSRWEDDGYRYRPIWYFHGHHTASPVTAAASAPSGPAMPAPTFGDVAASFAGWIEGTTSSMAASLAPVSFRPPGHAGVIDLSGADAATKAFFEAMSKGGGGSGGGGGGCACAGCACACACAGGGR